MLRHCCAFAPDTVITSPIVGKVLRPGEQVNVLQVPYAPAIADGWKRLDQARFGFVYSACYCSTLNDCFDVRSDSDEPQPVAACVTMPRDEQWRG